MKKQTEIVVIGGGVMGLSIAYNLAKKGAKDVVLLEKGYLGSGATGRCGSGIRAQYAKKERVIMAREAIRKWENLSDELGHDVKFKQGGYMYLLYDKEEIPKYREFHKMHHSVGVNTQMISVEDAKEIVPGLNFDGVVAVSFHDKDGKANPFGTVFAYAGAAKRLGVEINNYTEVTDLKWENEKWMVTTNQGRIEANNLVIAAGSWSSLLGKMIDVDIPVRPFVEEALITEPVAEGTINPLVNIQSPLYDYTWFTQTTVNNGIIAGWGHLQWVPEVISYDMTVSKAYIQKLTKNLVKVMPGFGNLNVIRHFSGFYDITADREPILDAIPEMSLYIAVAAAYMHPPICGQAMAELLLDGKSECIPIEAFNLERFKHGVERVVY